MTEKKRDYIEIVKQRFQETHFKLRDSGKTSKEAFKETGKKMRFNSNFAMNRALKGRLRFK